MCTGVVSISDPEVSVYDIVNNSFAMARMARKINDEPALCNGIRDHTETF